MTQNEPGGLALCEIPEPDLEISAVHIPTPQPQRGPFRAYRLLAAVLILRPLGNASLAWGMKHFPQVMSLSPLPYFRAMMNPFVAVGIAALLLGLLTRMALLSLADLSFVLPLTATGYIFSTLLGRFFLSEQVSYSGWLGTLLIFLGTALVGSTAQKTPVHDQPSNISLDVTLT